MSASEALWKPFTPNHLTTGLPDERFWQPQTTPFKDERGVWHVFDYESVARLMTDRRHFSQQYGTLGDPAVNLQFRVPWAFDGATHRGLRKYLEAAFEFRNIENKFTSRIAGFSADIISTVHEQNHPERGEFEVMSTLGRLSGQVIRSILGMPLDDGTEQQLEHWMRACEEAENPLEPPDLSEAANLINDVIETRKKTGGNDEPIDRLIGFEGTAEIADGHVWGRTETIGQVWGVLFAGKLTTKKGIGNVAYMLATERGLADALRQHPEQQGAAIAEVDRLLPPFPSVPVAAIAPVALAGADIQPYEPVTGWISSANRDPRHFKDPNSFDQDRRSGPGVSQSLTFAIGPHMCIGKGLSRLERTILLGQILPAFPGIELAADRPVVSDGPFTLGPEDLHLAYGA